MIPKTEDDVLKIRCCGPADCGEQRPIDPQRPDGPKARYCIGAECMGYRTANNGAPYCGLAGEP